MADKPCKHCGHCPTCGHVPRPVVYPQPYYVPVYPQPTVQPHQWWNSPYRTTCGSITYTDTSGTSVASGGGGTQYMTVTAGAS